MSFAIIISEKGGAERRELFDKSEIVVGRLQGNDLMLQKSNVSKRHARLLFREGRFIVADLESTNGTYVNGRKIQKATVVREGDKIYVGDFVLRFEAGPGVVLSPESAATAPGPREATSAEMGQSPSVPTPAPREPISHYPLEHDPDEGQQNPRVAIPAAPRIPSMARGNTQAMPTAIPPGPPAAPPRPESPQGPATDAGSSQIFATAHAVASGMGGGAPRPGSSGSPTVSPPVAPASLKPEARRDAGGGALASAAYRLALTTLVDAVAERLDGDTLRLAISPVDNALAQRVEHALREQLAQLRQEGDLPDGVDFNALVRDAHRELLALGPLGPLLDDDEISLIQVPRHDQVLVQRGAALTPVDPVFSGDDGLRRVVARLCASAQQPLTPSELLVERWLPRAHLLAVLSPLSSQGTTVTLRKRRRAEPPLEDPVRVGVVTRLAWNFLVQCLSARLSALVVGPPQASALIGSLAAALPPDERVAFLQPPEQPLPAPSHALTFVLEAELAEALVRQVSRMAFDRVVAGALAGPVSAALLGSFGGRAAPLLGLAQAPGLRQALGRLVADLCLAHPGLSPDAAREWAAASFDLVIEVARLRDGRLRVLRIAETQGAEQGSIVCRDLFLFVPDRAGEGALAPTGVVPRCLDELRQRGFTIDPSIFERVSSR